MKAIVINETCKAEDLKVSEIEIPKVRSEWILIKIKSFGINRSEIILHEYEANEPYINLPIVPGIECVGEVVDESDSKFNKVDLVIGLMGGMGRSFNGSYAEYTLLPEKNVFKVNEKIKNNLSIEEIASIPETYFTAYCSLFES
ncbi:MAG: alcohol dehydrogenase catalytic domain-containing protein [Methanobrevibacter sp.]